MPIAGRSFTDSGTATCHMAGSSPDFSLSLAPTSLSIAQGGSGTSTATVTSLHGFSSATTLSATGLPSGVTASFLPNPVTPPAGAAATSTLTLAASSTAASGTFSVTVTGTSGSISHSATLTLTVTAADLTAVFDPALKAPKCATVGRSCDSLGLLLGRDGVGPEPNQPNTIHNSSPDGALGTFHVNESNDRIKVSTMDGTRFAPGKTVQIEATVWAGPTPAADKLDLYYAADATNPSWIYITTVAPVASGKQTLTAAYTLPVGTLQAVRARFRVVVANAIAPYDDVDDLIFAVQ